MYRASTIRKDLYSCEKWLMYWHEVMQEYRMLEATHRYWYYAGRRRWLLEELLKAQLKEFDRG